MLLGLTGNNVRGCLGLGLTWTLQMVQLRPIVTAWATPGKTYSARMKVSNTTRIGFELPGGCGQRYIHVASAVKGRN